MLSRADLAEMNAFLCIANRGSFRLAAQDLGLTTSALSHTLRRLEARLDVRLINRTTRSVALTAAGRELALALSKGLGVIEEGVAALDGHRHAPVGRLRLTVPRDAARLVVGPALPAFVRRFPQVHVDMVVDDRPVDMVGEGFDAGIRYGGRVPQDMVAVPLTGPLRWIVVGSPAYLRKWGTPATPDDLYQHSCIQMRLGDSSNYPWELGDDDALLRMDVPGPVRVNETEAAVDAALRGIGLAYCLEMRVRAELQDGRLQQVLPAWSSMGEPFTLYHPHRRLAPPGLRPLIDTIRALALP